MKILTVLARRAPPLWLMLLASALLAALLLALFVDTLQQHLQRSAEWRRAQSAAVRPPAVSATEPAPVVAAAAR